MGQQNKLKTWIVIFIIASVLFFMIGFSKINSDKMYVGGDAYNFIINANQAIAYLIISMFFGLVSTGLGIIKAINKNNAMESDINNYIK